MTFFLELVISGVALGAVYGLIALSFVLIYKISGVLSLAQPGLLFLGALVIAKTVPALGFGVAVLVGVMVAALAGVGVHLVLRLLLRYQNAVNLSIATIGFNLILLTVLSNEVGPDVVPLGDPWGGSVVRWGAISLPQSRIVSLAVAVIVVAALAVVLRRSGWGVAMRATAEDPCAAALMGFRTRRLALSAWGLSGALAALAGLFLASFPSPGVDASISAVALAAFPAGVIGGLDSTLGALVGGLIVGFAVSFAAGYQDVLSFLGSGFPAVVPYLVMLVVLILRPSGLFGEREVRRV
jgi:branched-chain amino acid transport system permease protein